MTKETCIIGWQKNDSPSVNYLETFFKNLPKLYEYENFTKILNIRLISLNDIYQAITPENSMRIRLTRFEIILSYSFGLEK